VALRDAARWKIEKLDTHRHNYVEWISAQQKVVAAASALTFGRPGGVICDLCEIDVHFTLQLPRFVYSKHNTMVGLSAARMMTPVVVRVRAVRAGQQPERPDVRPVALT
jgi:hypothetical protein